MIHLTINPDGTARCLYSEEIDLPSLGFVSVNRVSTVEWDEMTQVWTVRKEHRGRVLFSSQSRQACLQWEQEHQEELLE